MLARNTADPRPETFRPVDEKELHPVAHIDTADEWRERRRIVLMTARVYDRLDELIAGAKANQVSLAVFRPTKIVDFISEEEERAWNPDKVREMRAGAAYFLWKSWPRPLPIGPDPARSSVPVNSAGPPVNDEKDIANPPVPSPQPQPKDKPVTPGP